jgi:hypothetical protein
MDISEKISYKAQIACKNLNSFFDKKEAEEVE